MRYGKKRHKHLKPSDCTKNGNDNISWINYFLSRSLFYEQSSLKITAVFDLANYQVIFNEDWVSERPWFEVVIIRVHETRHVYQQYGVKNQKLDPQETLDNWYNDIKKSVTY